MNAPAKQDQRTKHPTKSGPGRRHGHKVAHPTAPVPTKGAGFGFVLHTNPKRNAERKLVKLFGARQMRIRGASLSVSA